MSSFELGPPFVGRAAIPDRNKWEDEMLKAALKEKGGTLSSDDLTPELMQILDAPTNGVLNAISRARNRGEVSCTIGPITDPSNPHTGILELTELKNPKQ